MSKFSVGDKVVVIANGGGFRNYEIGNEYIIEGIGRYSGGVGYLVEGFRNRGASYEGYVGEQSFKLLSRALEITLEEVSYSSIKKYDLFYHKGTLCTKPHKSPRAMELKDFSRFSLSKADKVSKVIDVDYNDFLTGMEEVLNNE